MKRIFVDNYAAIPSETIRRLLALRDAGVLRILGLGQIYDLKTTELGTTIASKGQVHAFDLFIDARGQRALKTRDLPFPSLRTLLLNAKCEVPKLAEDYSLLCANVTVGQVAMGAIPYLMHDRPFVQGITACAEIGQRIAAFDVHETHGPRETLGLAA